jgi:hypothetical protein
MVSSCNTASELFCVAFRVNDLRECAPLHITHSKGLTKGFPSASFGFPPGVV